MRMVTVWETLELPSQVATNLPGTYPTAQITVMICQPVIMTTQEMLPARIQVVPMHQRATTTWQLAVTTVHVFLPLVAIPVRELRTVRVR